MAVNTKKILLLPPLLLFVVVLCAGSVCSYGDGNFTLSLAVFLPLTTTDLVGARFLPSLEIALELINNKSDLLPGYTIEAEITDSNVHWLYIF